MQPGSATTGNAGRPFFSGALAIALLFSGGTSALAQPAAQPLPQNPPPAENRRPAAPPPRISSQVPNGNEMVGPVKLRDDSIDQVLGLLERWTGRTVLRPQGLPTGTYTLTLDQPVPKEEAVLALETLLNLNGVAVAPMGPRFMKVMPLNLARAESPVFIEGSTLELAPSGRVATKLFQLNFLRVSEFLPQIAAILNPGLGAAPVIFEKSNSALITDSVSNLQRIETLVQALDQPLLASNTTKFYPLTAAKASDVVNKLRTLLTGPLQMQLGATTTYLADDRTNQIMLVSDPRQQPFFDDLIAKLDVQADPNTRNEVIFLKNASAKDVAALLSQLVSGQNEAANRAGDQARTTNAPATPGAPPPAAAPQPLQVADTVSVDPSDEFSDLLTILPEERTNAIVVSGTLDDIRLIRELVDQIDILLKQVRIEVVIAEVTLGDEATSGISELGLRIQGDKLVGFSSIAPGITVTNGTLTTGTNGSTDLAADIRLVTTPRKNNTTILSVPTIITTHNKEGSIFVGEQRPILSSYLNDAGSSGLVGSGYRTTITSKDIGIQLTVKPLIGNDGSVQLEITQEVNDILGEVIIDGNSQPRIGRRTTKSFVSVKNNEIIVLGGLQRTSQSRTTSRLGPIPIIGDLLGSRRRDNTRTDLVFFLRPYVLTNTPADNEDALRRIEQGPQRDAVRAALDPAFILPQPKAWPLRLFEKRVP